MRRVRLVVLVVAAVLCVGCEMTVDNTLTIRADGSGTLVSAISYDQAAREVIGDPESFVTDIVEANVRFLDGVRITSVSLGDEVERSHVDLTIVADGPEALDRLVAEAFIGSFTPVDGDRFALLLVGEDWIREAGPTPPDLTGTTTVVVSGTITDVEGGQLEADDRVRWEQFGQDDLEAVVELSGGGPFSGIAGRTGWLYPVVLLAAVGLGAVGLVAARRR